MSRTCTIRLPWPAPPLSLNDRTHWRSHAAKVKSVRALTAATVANACQARALDHVDVRLVYVPRDKRRRDPDNLTATYKVCCDALIDAGLVPDDEPRYMTKHMPTILPPDGDPRLELRITDGAP